MYRKLIKVTSVIAMGSIFNVENGHAIATGDINSCVAHCKEVFDAGKSIIAADEDEKILKAYRLGGPESVDMARWKQAKLRESELQGQLLGLVTQFSQCKTDCGGDKHFVDGK
jgi:hypothetical protein